MITLNTVQCFIRQIIFHYQDKQCQKSAAALTYMTLFAIVPMMTVSYSMFSVILAFSGQEVQQYLAGFSSQVRSLTPVGVIMLVVTAYLMLKNIEVNFNSIWGVKEGRKGLANFLLYWTVLSLGPLILGMGLAVTTYWSFFKLFEGAETQGVLSTFSDGVYGQYYSDLVATLLVLWAFHQRCQQGESLTDRHAAEVGVDGRQWASIRQAL